MQFSLHNRYRFAILAICIASALSAPCSDTQIASADCHTLAACDYDADTDVASCSCAPEMLGDGVGADGCRGTGWNVRFVVSTTENVIDTSSLETVMGIDCADSLGTLAGCDHVHFTKSARQDGDGNQYLGVNFLFPDESSADSAVAAANVAASYADGVFPSEYVEYNDIIARKYAWVAGTTSQPLQVRPAGMEVTFVEFIPSCAENGCWSVEVEFTVGFSDVVNPGSVRGFNSFYLPYAVGSDELSYDLTYSNSIVATFSPNNFPCNSDIPDRRFECCYGSPFDLNALGLQGDQADLGTKGFLGKYRTTDTFNTFASARSVAANAAGCGTIPAEEPTFDSAMEMIGELGDEAFVGLSNSPGITNFKVIDPYVGMYAAIIKIDEVELRTLAGQLKGTVGVEHTVDFFIGYANFKPATGTNVLDSLAAQTDIHVEKTSFFTVSVHGENDYTFLSYVNMRLVTVYNQDIDFSDSTGESADRTTRTDSSGHADYVQVTFTVNNDKYLAHPNSGLIPLDSVRAGQGTFYADADMQHKCMQWDDSFDGTFEGKDTFVGRLGQDCAPVLPSRMCVNPTAIPDQFAVINIPLGIEAYADASNTLDNNVFVHMVVTTYDEDAAQNSDADAPNDGGAPFQMKTTLFASIPIVQGGLNIFCDGITAKTDLKDVADVDIVVGSASYTENGDELGNLRILSNVTSTELQNDQWNVIDSDSIEAGLMTFVIKGSESYFGVGNAGRSEVSVELEDLITIHIMDSDGDAGDGSGASESVSAQVETLMSAATDDNSFSGGLDVNGYDLNDAFSFWVDRASQRAHLEPSSALLSICPFNPPRPANGNMPAYTCVTRRDVRYREYPWRQGAMSTAMEICVGGVCPASPSSVESDFMVTVLGESVFARDLGMDYANIIDNRYNLNGRFRRAYWVNPGYEWTPTQTGGASPFAISQKYFLFALITLDEGIGGVEGNTLCSTGLNTGAGPYLGGSAPSCGDRRRGEVVRRRMLLQTGTDQLQGSSSGAANQKFETNTSPAQLLAKSFEVPIDRVATFSVEMQLTATEACLDMSAMQESIRATLDDYVSGSASATKTVQVTKISVDKGSVSCGRRSLRSLLAYSDATATVDMIVVFEEGTSATFSVEKFGTMAGIASVAPVSVSDKVDTSAPVDYSPPADKDGDDSSDNIGVIVGAAVGGVVAVALIAGVVMFMKKRNSAEQEVVAVQSINVADLKAQLGPDV